MDVARKRECQLNSEEDWFEVIDGQQRLTTIYLILVALRQAIEVLGLPTGLYDIRYQRTTKDFNPTEFLKNIEQISKIDDSYIDYFHISTAFFTIKKWLKEKQVNKGYFSATLLDQNLETFNPPRDKANNIRFIWYESVDEDPIKVFTRLNVGKISLTNAELIKALFLKSSNFTSDTNVDYLRLRQQEIASEWDKIEYTLQNDEFWLFLNEKNYDKPTRIDFILDLICKQKALGIFDNIGTDDYKTFRYFYGYFNSDNKDISFCWNKIKKLFQTFQEWFDDLELYHYVGYLICQNEKIEDLYKDWCNGKSKTDFILKLKNKIKEKIKDCKDLNEQYEKENEKRTKRKTKCRPLLLLHNVQTVITQNKQLETKEEYKLAIFYKFPFHLFKKEQWDVEHIDSNSTNDLDDIDDQKEWLKYSALDTTINDALRKKIKDFVNDSSDKISFENLRAEIEKLNLSSSWKNPQHDKNKIWNFVLLDAGTNRGYGNAIFPVKRRCIIGKDQGKTYTIDDNLTIKEKDGAIAFIPPVTKNVFLKYYNTSLDNLREWSECDARAYRTNIFETLKEFDVIDSSVNGGEKNEH